MGLELIEKIDQQVAAARQRITQLHEDNAACAAYIERWHAQHEIRNLMGRFAIYYSAGQYTRAGAMFSCTDQVYLQRSDIGIFEGREAVANYFAQLEKRSVPGSFRMMPITSEIIELSEDGESAQGMWFINGLEAIKDPRDPSVPASDLWVNDKLAVEFIRENGKWVILRMNINEEMRATYHKCWGDYAEAPEYPAFDTFPSPTRPATRHKPFAPDRKSGKNLTTPEPYGSYADLADHY